MILSALLLTPLVGALLISLWPRPLETDQARLGALITLGVTMALSVYLVSQFDIGNSGFQFVEQISWLETLGLSYRLGVDGIALPLVVMNSLLSFVAVYISSSMKRAPALLSAVAGDCQRSSGGFSGAKSAAVFPVLRARADSAISADCYLGRCAARLRSDQVFNLYGVFWHFDFGGFFGAGLPVRQRVALTTTRP